MPTEAARVADAWDHPGDPDDPATRPPTPLSAYEDEATSAPQEEPEILPLIDLAAWAEVEPKPKSFVLRGFIPEREVTLLSGVGGSNKSGFGQQLCACSAQAIPMLGLPTEGGPALYVTAEDDTRELHWRHAHILKALRIGDPLAAVGKLHLVSIRGELENQLVSFSFDGRMTRTPTFHKLRATIAQKRPRLVVLDNVAHLFGGNENDRVQVTQFVNALYSLCNEFGCSIVLIAHPNKSGDDYSGTTAWPNSVRSHIVIRRPKDHPDPDVREMELAKANYARVGETVVFRWHAFALILDADLPEDVRAALAATAMATADNEAFLRCLDARNAQERPVSESRASRTFAPKEFAAMAESNGIGRPRLEAAMDRLFRIGSIETGKVCHTGGKDRYGLRRKCADLCADLPPTPCADPRRQETPTCADLRPHTPDYIRGGRGPSGAAAPADDDEEAPF
jgi:RecA-family ATPase